MLHRVKIAPLRTREYSELTGCDVMRTVAWRFECSCKAKGKWRKSFGEARRDFAEHRIDLRRA